MSNVRSLENQLAETEHSLNATRIDLEAFKISEGNKSAQQQSEQESNVLNQLNITTFERFEEVIYALNATRIDLQQFKTLEGNKSAQQQSEMQNQQSELQRQQTDIQTIREELLLVQNVTNSIVKRYHPEFQGKL